MVILKINIWHYFLHWNHVDCCIAGTIVALYAYFHIEEKTILFFCAMFFVWPICHIWHIGRTIVNCIFKDQFSDWTAVLGLIWQTIVL